MSRTRPVAKRSVALSLALLSLVAGLAAGCGSSDDKGFRRDGSAIDGDPSTTLPAALAATTLPPITGSRAAGAPLPAQTNVTGVSTDLTKKPAVPKATGTAPKALSGTDVVTGTGAEVKDGDKLSVRYVGVLYTTGKQFDSSWDRGKAPFTFTIGQGAVIPGWDQGLIGMKVGGRRVLVIPSALAYGAQGSGTTIPANSDLIFIVDLTKIG